MRIYLYSDVLTGNFYEVLWHEGIWGAVIFDARLRPPVARLRRGLRSAANGDLVEGEISVGGNAT